MMKQNKPEQHTLPSIIPLLVISLACLDLWAAFFPTGRNWGFHSLAFYGIEIRIVIPLLMLVLVIPTVQMFLVRLVRNSGEWFYSRKRIIKIVLTAAILAGFVLLFSSFRVKTFFLGDGQLCLRGIQHVETIEDLSWGYKREPLVGFFIVQLSNVFILLKDLNPTENAYRWLSILSGFCFVVVAWKLVKYFSKDRIDKVLLFIVLFASGASQLFFGYVENYSPAYPGILLFIFLCLAYIRKEVSIVWPVTIFGVLLTLHFGTLVFLPAIAMLIYLAVQRKQSALLGASLFLMCSIVVALLQISGYTPQLLQSVFVNTSNHFIPIFGPLNEVQAYTFFTWNHFIDIFNFIFLNYLTAIMLLIPCILMFRKKPKPIVTEAWFLLLAAACGLAFIVILNCDLGMSRDWDILVPIGAGIPVLFIFAWTTVAEDKAIRQRILMIAGIIALLYSAAFVGVNANEQRAIDRFQILQDEQLWSKRARLDAYEELAIYYREHNEHDKVVQYYARYVQLDSTNQRLLVNLAGAYAKLGDTSKAIETYESMMRMGITNPLVLRNLGMLLAGQQRFSEALFLLKRAEESYPTSPIIKFDIGIIVAENEKAYDKALYYFLDAIQLDSTYSSAYYNAAQCYLALNDTKKAIQYLALSKYYAHKN